MASIVRSIHHNLARVADFSGRETNKEFWPYALFLIFGSGVVGMLVVLPTVLDSLRRMQRFALEHPDQATVTSGPGTYSIEIQGYHPELMPDFSSFLLITAAANGFILVLLAASITRRLHDSDHRGWWAFLPLPFAVSGTFLMLKIFAMAADSGTPDPRLFFTVVANNLLYLGLMGFLILLLARPGTPAPNRFGPERAAD